MNVLASGGGRGRASSHGTVPRLSLIDLFYKLSVDTRQPSMLAVVAFCKAGVVHNSAKMGIPVSGRSC